MSSGPAPDFSGKTSIFWLHIKKSAGLSTRKMLGDLYPQTDRNKMPTGFLQAPKAEYNDILNNFRVLLGPYQFKRCQFAQKYLYPDDFETRFRFAFSRDPLARCMSQFRYLWARSDPARLGAKTSLMTDRLVFDGTPEQDFDRFLAAIEECRASTSNIKPYGLHFQTHVAAMADDITDDQGKSLMDAVFRLEDLFAAINMVRVGFGHAPIAPDAAPHLNRSRDTGFQPTPAQRTKVRALFAADYEIYEGKCWRDFS
tara:strand:- start:463 stop:1230 length:768 start_codon:yes stop_codon:yes gene_type:complete